LESQVLYSDYRPPPFASIMRIALECRTSRRRFEIAGAVFVQEADEGVATEVRRVRQRRTPVAIGANENVLIDE
jgi:hypothetical protein